MTTETSDENLPIFTLIAIHSEDEILHKMFESLEELNTFIKTDIDKKGNSALVFVIEGTLMSESQWRLPDDQTDKYWTII